MQNPGGRPGTVFLRALSNFNDDTPDDVLQNLLKECWNKNPDRCMKLIFYTLDCACGKGQRRCFHRCMQWVYEHHRESFYRNYSLIIGRPNKSMIQCKVLQETILKQYKCVQKNLDEFVDKTLHASFFENLYQSALEVACRMYPPFGNYQDIIDVYEIIHETNDRDLRSRTAQLLASNRTESVSVHSDLLKQELERIPSTPPPKVAVNGTMKSRDNISFEERYFLISS